MFLCDSQFLICTCVRSLTLHIIDVVVSKQDRDVNSQRRGPVDWRTLRSEGWNRGGLGARNKRMILRMQQQLVNQQRQLLGLGTPATTLQQQVRDDQIRMLTANMLETARFRAGIEQAMAAGQGTSKCLITC